MGVEGQNRWTGLLKKAIQSSWFVFERAPANQQEGMKTLRGRRTTNDFQAAILLLGIPLGALAIEVMASWIYGALTGGQPRSRKAAPQQP